LFGEGYELVYEDSLGELEVSVYFAQAAGERQAARAAHGWGGDRLYAYRDADGVIAIVWISTWDDESEAIQAEEAALRVLNAAPKPARASQLVERSGRALLIARNLPARLHAGVRDRFLIWASTEQAPKKQRPDRKLAPDAPPDALPDRATRANSLEDRAATP
jgi:hypothetical protein